MVLTGAQALGGASPSIIISLGGLVGLMLADDNSLATLPSASTTSAWRFRTMPAAMLMRRMGRRIAYCWARRRRLSRP